LYTIYSSNFFSLDYLNKMFGYSYGSRFFRRLYSGTSKFFQPYYMSSYYMSSGEKIGSCCDVNSVIKNLIDRVMKFVE